MNENKNDDVTDAISDIHNKIKELFPTATSVKIFVNCEGIEVAPQYRTNISGYSMQDINGRWVKKEDAL